MTTAPPSPVSQATATAGDPTAGGDARDAKILADLCNAVQEPLMFTVGANILCVGLVCALLWGNTNTTGLLVWGGLQCATAAIGVRTALRMRGRPAHAGNAARRMQATTRGAMATGLLWGAGLLLLWPDGRLDLQLFLMLIVTGLVAGAMNSLNAHLPAYYGFVLPCAVGVVTAFALQGDGLHYAIAVAAASFGLSSWHFARALHRTLVEAIRGRYEVAELAADLEVQRNRAEVQRNRAEAASLSKSRFLAAASHDLRQPLHALNLFVGALENRPLDAQSAQIVHDAGTTLASMGSMFNALLDVSRLEAGMVKPQICAFDLKPLLLRIGADEAAPAQSKGLSLRLNLPTLPVQTDPVLLERIVRNLISNAVRYTRAGGILVSARVRNGVAVLRVTDTGVGIAPQEQGRIFEEFVQLHNPERDQTKGLGLGLSIVRHLTGLLNVPLTLTSKPGKGSTMTLRLPLANGALVQALSNRPTAHLWSPGGHQRLVLVVDDHAEGRQATAKLLRDWGCEVILAEGQTDLMPQLQKLTAPPDLLICDYRLRCDETGLGLIALLNNEYNQTIPSILVTGDTSPERLQELEDTSQHTATLMHKPVSAPELLAQVSRLLGKPAA